jgi:DNA-binding response OmpR family regulator
MSTDDAAPPVTEPVSPTMYVVGLADRAPARVVEAIRSELRELVTIDGDLFSCTPMPGAVYLVWAPATIAPDRLAAVVGWASAVDPRPGLIGVAAVGSAADAEAGLAAGFDDFVVGTPSARELAARLRAVLRRVHWTGLARPGRLRFGALTLDLDGHELWIDGRTIHLTSTELGVLRALVRGRGRTLSRGELLDHAWSEGDLEVSERAVDNVILRLRRKLPRPDLIQTVRGVGFRLSTD